ncbi:hypothetical protein ETQ85_24525 [Zoogloea oleivorans]|uniref:Uncharacterized protein n=1 Tax=Zoogloea oleivorans TaxID=1552750 RepID=A0A6C2CDA2_9RHOO|nr:hypothetical protein [Zoogloea oleivorans]TYC51393.1 hypothetical protein ETQ85_24525 [Zoogloea oleivorans]
MSMTDSDELTFLLSSFFDLMGGGPSESELSGRLRAINKLDDLNIIDSDLDDPLWRVVPQIIMHRFGLAAFQSFKARHKAGASFVFVHPAHSHIVPQLQDGLRQRWTVNEPISRELTPELICGLYGGYRWHAAYAAACKYRGDIGRLATILPLSPCSDVMLQDLIAYKNDNRANLAEKIVIPRENLGQVMDGIIQAFHCPDVIENSRQLMNLGLADSIKISDSHA